MAGNAVRRVREIAAGRRRGADLRARRRRAHERTDRAWPPPPAKANGFPRRTSPHHPCGQHREAGGSISPDQANESSRALRRSCKTARAVRGPDPRACSQSRPVGERARRQSSAMMKGAQLGERPAEPLDIVQPQARHGGARRMRSTACPRPGTRSSISRRARLTSTGNVPGCAAPRRAWGRCRGRACRRSRRDDLPPRSRRSASASRPDRAGARASAAAAAAADGARRPGSG